jgi:hypothetical protein
MSTLHLLTPCRSEYSRQRKQDHIHVTNRFPGGIVDATIETIDVCVNNYILVKAQYG